MSEVRRDQGHQHLGLAQDRSDRALGHLEHDRVARRGQPDQVPPPQRLGQALLQRIEMLPALDQLLEGLAPAGAHVELALGRVRSQPMIDLGLLLLQRLQILQQIEPVDPGFDDLAARAGALALGLGSHVLEAGRGRRSARGGERCGSRRRPWSRGARRSFGRSSSAGPASRRACGGGSRAAAPPPHSHGPDGSRAPPPRPPDARSAR